MTINSYYKKLYEDSSVEEYCLKGAQIILGLIKNEIKENDKVLEAGCGNGEFAVTIKERLGVNVTGIEISKSGIKKAKEKGINVIRGNLQNKLPFREGEFDVVFSGQVLEHLYDPDFFLDECFRVLKKGGKLILTTPNLAAWFNRIIFLFGYQPFFMETSTVDKTVGLSFTCKLTKERQVAGHVRVFTLGALKDILKLHKFQCETIKGYSGGYFPIWMQQFDSFISLIPSLASNIYLIARKINI